MQIHTKLPGESLQDIAVKYGISEGELRAINQIGEGEAAEGEELLILYPTRSYTVQHGDTPEGIALRFGIRKNDLYMLNPWLYDAPFRAGQKIALKYGERRGGMAVANGYCFKGCDKRALGRALPYLTYVTFAAAVADRRGVHRSVDFRKEAKMVVDERKIPLLRVYDRYTERYLCGEDHAKFAEAMISLAIADGYKGLVINSCPLSNSAEEFIDFLMILRKRMIGCDLILITEIDENSPLEFSEYADGSVMYYPKFAMDDPPSFEDGERRILSDFACRAESAKTFIDLPSVVRHDGDFLSHGELRRQARKRGYKARVDENTLLSHVSDGKQGEYCFASMKCIKALLDLTSEFDYMGISFDVMRTPLSHIMMYNSMFKTSYLSSVRTREGCSRAGEE